MTGLIRICITVLLATVITVGAFGQAAALDWGGSLTSTNTVQSVSEGSDDEPFVNTERLVLYLTAPLGERWEFVSQAAATFNSEPVFAVDAEKFYVRNVINFTDDDIERTVEQRGGLIQLGTRFGRFNLADPTGQVMSHTVDGVNVSISGVSSEIEIGVGYTGLLNKEFSQVSMSQQDSADADDTDVYFGPPRLLGRGTVAFPELVAGQNVSLGFAFQQDLRDPDSVIQEGATQAQAQESAAVGGLLDTQYAILTMDGPIPGVSSLFYSLSYVFNSGRTIGLLPDDEGDDDAYQYKPIVGHLVDGTVQYFIPNFYSSVASVGAVYSSGDSDYASFTEGNSAGTATMFTAVTPAARGAVFGLQSGNSTVGEVSYSMKPFSASDGILDSLQTRAVLYTFFRSAGSGAVSVSDVDANADGMYLGSEIDLDIRWRPLSDVGLGLTTGFLFANDDVRVDGTNSFDYRVRLSASLSF
ncbi:MAG: hypothetical protein ACOCYB_07350 [Alkalispirochaeta sp.]